MMDFMLADVSLNLVRTKVLVLLVSAPSEACKTKASGLQLFFQVPMNLSIAADEPAPPPVSELPPPQATNAKVIAGRIQKTFFIRISVG
jgi:hypothetical protein